MGEAADGRVASSFSDCEADDAETVTESNREYSQQRPIALERFCTTGACAQGNTPLPIAPDPLDDAQQFHQNVAVR